MNHSCMQCRFCQLLSHHFHQFIAESLLCLGQVRVREFYKPFHIIAVYYSVVLLYTVQVSSTISISCDLLWHFAVFLSQTRVILVIVTEIEQSGVHYDTSVPNGNDTQVRLLQKHVIACCRLCPEKEPRKHLQQLQTCTNLFSTKR